MKSNKLSYFCISRWIGQTHHLLPVSLLKNGVYIWKILFLVRNLTFKNQIQRVVIQSEPWHNSGSVLLAHSSPSSKASRYNNTKFGTPSEFWVSNWGTTLFKQLLDGNPILILIITIINPKCSKKEDTWGENWKGVCHMWNKGGGQGHMLGRCYIGTPISLFVTLIYVPSNKKSPSNTTQGT